MDLQWVGSMIVFGIQLIDWLSGRTERYQWHWIGSIVLFCLVGIRLAIKTLAWQSNGIGVVMQQIGVDWQLSGFLLTAEWLLA